MTEKLINHVREKCLDCWNYKKIWGKWQCLFGLEPVFLLDKTGRPGVCVCNGYITVPGKEAPALTGLLKRTVKLKKKATEKKEKN